MVLVTVVTILLKQRLPSHVYFFPFLYRIEAAKNNRTNFGYILAFIDELNPFLDKDLNTFRVKS